MGPTLQVFPNSKGCAVLIQRNPHDPIVCSPAGSSVHGILQARILEWVATSSSRASSRSSDQTSDWISISFIFCIGRQILYHRATWESPIQWKSLSRVWLFATLLSISLQARILKWVAAPFSRRSSKPRDRTQVSYLAGRFFTTEPPGIQRWGPIICISNSCSTTLILLVTLRTIPIQFILRSSLTSR